MLTSPGASWDAVSLRLVASSIIIAAVVCQASRIAAVSEFLDVPGTVTDLRIYRIWGDLF
jgi:hypothetical protein